MRSVWIRWWTIAPLGLGLIACGNSSGSRQPLTERQRDSVIAGSTLPGAATVGKALERSDDAKERAASLDSLTR